MLRASLLAIAVLLAVPAAGSAAACPKGARCSVIQVPLDHSGATPGAIPLAYAVMPATGTSIGTIVILSGGPGQSAIPLTRDVTALLDRIHLDHDIVFVDQRGTGDSGAVKCDDVSTPAFVAQWRRATKKPSIITAKAVANAQFPLPRRTGGDTAADRKSVV